MKEKDTLFWLSFCSLFGALKIVGMTMTCNRCDVMNIMWCKTEMEQKSEGERWDVCGGGGGGGRVLSFGIRIHEKKKQPILDPTLEKEEGFQFQTSQGMNGKIWVPGGWKPISQMQCKPYDINLNEGFIVIKLKAQENKTKLKERERGTHTLPHNRTCVCMY